MKIKMIIMLLAITSFTGCWVTSEDVSYTGYVTGIAKKGVIWRTGQVWSKTDIESSQEYVYCIEDEEIYQKLKKYEVSKEKVTMIMHSEGIVAPWRCGNETWIIDSIK